MFESILKRFNLRSCFAGQQDREWERFLESDYEEIISILQRSSSPLASYSRKHLYHSLCTNPILIGDGSLSLTLDEENGKKCYMVGARGLTIEHTKDPTKWKLVSPPDSNDFSSRFSSVAQLLEVYWFDVKGKIETRILYPKKYYKAYLVFKFCQPRDGFDGRIFKSSIYIEGRESDGTSSEVNIPRESTNRADGWMEIKLGQFLNDEDDSHRTVVCHLTDHDTNIMKSGIIIEGIEFRVSNSSSS